MLPRGFLRHVVAIAQYRPLRVINAYMPFVRCGVGVLFNLAECCYA